MRIAKVENNIVVEIKEQDDITFLEQGWYLCGRLPIEIGWTQDQDRFTPPLPPLPPLESA